MIEQSEFLDANEIITITGHKWSSKQIEWLKKNRWYFELNAAQKPIVGRIYARQRLLGIKVNIHHPAEWHLDLSNVR